MKSSKYCAHRASIMLFSQFAFEGVSFFLPLCSSSCGGDPDRGSHGQAPPPHLRLAVLGARAVSLLLLRHGLAKVRCHPIVGEDAEAVFRRLLHLRLRIDRQTPGLMVGLHTSQKSGMINTTHTTTSIP